MSLIKNLSISNTNTQRSFPKNPQSNTRLQFVSQLPTMNVSSDDHFCRFGANYKDHPEKNADGLDQIELEPYKRIFAIGNKDLLDGKSNEIEEFHLFEVVKDGSKIVGTITKKLTEDHYSFYRLDRADGRTAKPILLTKKQA
jgi:hypothetical protein